MNHYRSTLTQYHKVSTSTVLYWPSTIMYWPVPPSIDPVPPSTNCYRLLLTRHISTSTTPYWPTTTKWQPVATYTHPVPPSTNHYSFYWPSIIIYQPVPLHTDTEPPSINHYQPILLLLGDYRLLHSLPWVLFSFAWTSCVPSLFLKSALLSTAIQQTVEIQPSADSSCWSMLFQKVSCCKSISLLKAPCCKSISFLKGANRYLCLNPFVVQLLADTSIHVRLHNITRLYIFCGVVVVLYLQETIILFC